MKATAQNTLEVECHKFIAEASELRFPVGRYPEILPTSLGNGMNFLLNRIEADGTAKYLQANGCIVLTVLND